MKSSSFNVFVSSSDAYSDIWPAFFTLFKRNWPAFRGVIYLNTENKTFKFTGLNIVCTKVGGGMRFGETLKAGLAKIQDDVLLLFMIDYFIERPVNVDILNCIYAAFVADNYVTSAALVSYHALAHKKVESVPFCSEIVPPGGFLIFSFQCAFWRKRSLVRLVMDWETPWMAEYFGCHRVNLARYRCWMLDIDSPMPIVYNPAGVLHGGGKWYRPALEHIDLENVPLNVPGDREFYMEPRYPRLKRIIGVVMSFHLVLRSYISLFRGFGMRSSFCEWSRFRDSLRNVFRGKKG